MTGVVYATGPTDDPIPPASSAGTPRNASVAAGTPPTGMTFEVSRLFQADALVEVEVVAAVPGTE